MTPRNISHTHSHSPAQTTLRAARNLARSPLAGPPHRAAGAMQPFLPPCTCSALPDRRRSSCGLRRARLWRGACVCCTMSAPSVASTSSTSLGCRIRVCVRRARRNSMPVAPRWHPGGTQLAPGASAHDAPHTRASASGPSSQGRSGGEEEEDEDGGCLADAWLLRLRLAIAQPL